MAIADLAWTAGTGRSHFNHRAAVVFRNAEARRDQLTALAYADAGAAPAPAR